MSRSWLAIGIIAWMGCQPRAPAPAPSPPVVWHAPPAPVPAPAAPCPDNPKRDPQQKPAHVIDLIDLADGMTVVDLGSGEGYFLCRLSRAVGSRGRVIATEVVADLVRGLQQRATREALGNVDVIHAPIDDVGIAAGAADRILLVNVWHHLRRRARYAGRIARALSPGGKVVVIDFRPPRPHARHGIRPELVLAELKAGGIDAAVVPDQLPGQYVIVGSVRK